MVWFNTTVKPLNKIIGKYTNKTVSIMTGQMAKMVFAVKTTVWRGNKDTWHSSSTKATIELSKKNLRKPLISYQIKSQWIIYHSVSTLFKTLTLQELQKEKKAAYQLQEATIDIVVERIVEFNEEKYVREINKKWCVFINSTILYILTHIQATWCKVLTQDKTEAKDAFLRPWIPPAQIITFVH